jgi:hypothetical protein
MLIKVGERSSLLIRIFNTIFFFLVFFPLSLIKRNFSSKNSFKLDKEVTTYWVSKNK